MFLSMTYVDASTSFHVIKVAHLVRDLSRNFPKDGYRNLLLTHSFV